MPELKILIVGAGLGGLSLAQALSRAEITCEIFERDDAPFDRPQGYRLHLDGDAINAAREVLTPELWRVFEQTSQWTEPYTTILGTDLSVIKRLRTNDDLGLGVWPAYDGPPIHANVDRATMRQILFAGLDEKVNFGKSLIRYESSAEGVTAHFSDGAIVTGDVLVGADGIRSAVRRQRAPHAHTVDAGITAIYGRMPLERAIGLAPAETLGDIFTIASDDRKVFLGLGAVRFPMAPDEAASSCAPRIAMRHEDDYVVCIVGGRHHFFPRNLRDAPGAELQQIAAETIGGWPDKAGALIRAGDARAFFPVEMYTSVPCALDDPTNVTLLGDAIHAMTPTLGRGANVAMRDGALLGRALKRVAKGDTELSVALAGYEKDMLAYGFGVVRKAAKIGEQRMAQYPLPA